MTELNMATKAEITNAIAGYVSKCGGAYSTWYIGIAADVKRRLFNDHAVSEKNDSWIYRGCENHDIARAIEKNFLDLGMKGGGGGGDSKTTYVYAYKITRSTIE
jgi:hypothetical protein